jgi:hypothetical protein
LSPSTSSGRRTVVERVTTFSFSLDWLPDRCLLIVSSELQREAPDGSLVRHADLSAHAAAWNEIVVEVGQTSTSTSQAST